MTDRNKHTNIKEILRQYKETRESYNQTASRWQLENNPYTKEDLRSEAVGKQYKLNNQATYLADIILSLGEGFWDESIPVNISEKDKDEKKVIDYKRLWVEANSSNLELKRELKETKDKMCFNCQTEDSCDDCKKPFCYMCLARIGNNLYCDACFWKKEKLGENDWIVKTQWVNNKGSGSFSQQIKRENEIEEMTEEDKQTERVKSKQSLTPAPKKKPLLNYKQKKTIEKARATRASILKKELAEDWGKQLDELTPEQKRKEYKKAWRKKRMLKK